MTTHETHEIPGIRELSRTECLDLLSRSHLGRLGFLDSVGVFPIVVPVNYLMYDGSVIFRTMPGAKLAAAIRGGDVAFEVDQTDELGKTGWSVLVAARPRSSSTPTSSPGSRIATSSRSHPVPGGTTSGSTSTSSPAGASTSTWPWGPGGTRPPDPAVAFDARFALTCTGFSRSLPARYRSGGQVARSRRRARPPSLTAARRRRSRSGRVDRPGHPGTGRSGGPTAKIFRN